MKYIGNMYQYNYVIYFWIWILNYIVTGTKLINSWHLQWNKIDIKYDICHVFVIELVSKTLTLICYELILCYAKKQPGSFEDHGSYQIAQI